MTLETQWWGSHNTTWVWFVLNKDSHIPEWRPMGYVVLRQIYEGLEPAWHAYQIKDDRLVQLGHRPELADARKLLREAVIDELLLRDGAAGVLRV
jgi:hypothetical protein